MEGLLEQFNAPALYALVGGAILLVVAMCVHFAVKSWRAGLRLGMERAVLKKAVVSSATFTLLPAFSILLGVAALWVFRCRGCACRSLEICNTR